MNLDDYQSFSLLPRTNQALKVWVVIGLFWNMRMGGLDKFSICGR